MSYNEIIEYLQNQKNKEDQVEWHFKCITLHESPLKPYYLNYNGSICNVIIE